MAPERIDKNFSVGSSEMSDVKRILCGGRGGQGIIVMGKMLGWVAMRNRYFITILPAYGAEVRGGEAYCSVVISSQPIAMPEFDKADYFITMNQISYDSFFRRLNTDGIIIFNSSMIKEKKIKNINQVGISATQIASDIGNIKIANLVMLGAFCKVTNIFKISDIINIMDDALGSSKKRYFELNKKALEQGWKIRNRR